MARLKQLFHIYFSQCLCSTCLFVIEHFNLKSHQTFSCFTEKLQIKLLLKNCRHTGWDVLTAFSVPSHRLCPLIRFYQLFSSRKLSFLLTCVSVCTFSDRFIPLGGSSSSVFVRCWLQPQTSTQHIKQLYLSHLRRLICKLLFSASVVHLGAPPLTWISFFFNVISILYFTSYITFLGSYTSFDSLWLKTTSITHTMLLHVSYMVYYLRFINSSWPKLTHLWSSM